MTAGRPKRHSASFRRVLVLVYGTVILFALLITGIYTCLLYTSPSPRDA